MPQQHDSTSIKKHSVPISRNRYLREVLYLIQKQSMNARSWYDGDRLTNSIFPSRKAPKLHTFGGKHNKRGVNDVCLDHRTSNDGSSKVRHVNANERTAVKFLVLEPIANGILSLTSLSTNWTMGVTISEISRHRCIVGCDGGSRVVRNVLRRGKIYKLGAQAF